MLQWKEIKQDNTALIVDSLEIKELGQTLIRVVTHSTQYSNKIESINEFMVPTPAAKADKKKSVPKKKVEPETKQDEGKKTPETKPSEPETVEPETVEPEKTESKETKGTETKMAPGF